MATADVRYTGACAQPLDDAIESGQPLGDEVGSITRPEEHFGAAKEPLIVLVPAESLTRAKSLEDALFVEPERSSHLEGGGHVDGAVFDGEDHGLRGGKGVAVSLRLVAHVAARGLVVEPFAHIALANTRCFRELFGGADADLCHGFVKP